MTKATDGDLKPSQSNRRSVVPIPSSIHHVPGYPKKLIIFLVAASPFWWTRCWFEGKHHKRSTRTQAKRAAIRFAKQFFEELIASKYAPAPTISKQQKKPSFLICAEGLIKEDEQRAARGEISNRYAESQRNIIKGYLIEQFGSYEVSEIEYGLMDDFKNDLHKRKLSTSTIKLAFATLSKIFNYAQRYGHIKQAPLKPKVKVKDNPRKFIPLHQYKELRRASQEALGKEFELRARKGIEVGRGKLLRRVTVTKDLIYAIPFMVYTFIRPSDLKTMQHKHIEIRSGARGDYLHMPIPETKKHDKPITSLPRATYFYKRLREHHQSMGYGGDNDYLFLPDMLNRDSAYDKISNQFEAVLSLIKKADDPVTLYSLRHTAIMYRLIYGGEINLLTLARNARTSVSMIERFYGSQLEGGMVVDELHAKRA